MAVASRSGNFDVLFETVIRAGGIGGGGRGLFQKVAKVNEMLMAGGALRELRFGPLENKFLGS